MLARVDDLTAFAWACAKNPKTRRFSSRGEYKAATEDDVDRAKRSILREKGVQIVGSM